MSLRISPLRLCVNVPQASMLLGQRCCMHDCRAKHACFEVISRRQDSAADLVRLRNGLIPQHFESGLYTRFSHRLSHTAVGSWQRGIPSDAPRPRCHCARDVRRELRLWEELSKFHIEPPAMRYLECETRSHLEDK